MVLILYICRTLFVFTFLDSSRRLKKWHFKVSWLQRRAARLKILAIDEAAAAPAAAAVVVFSTLATAAAASNSPLGVPDRAAAPAKKGPATPAAKSPAARSPGKLVASPSARKPGRRHWLSGSLLDKLTTSVTGLTPRSRT